MHRAPDDSPRGSPGAAGGCPDSRQLAAALDPATSEDELDALSRHLEACADCRTKLAELAGIGNWPEGALASPAAPPELRSAMAALKQAPPDGQDGPDEASDPADEADESPVGLEFLTPVDLPGYLGRFGPYNVIDVVGHGGMGVVLRAHDPSLNRVVAIKVLKAVLAASPIGRSRFVREARAAAAVSHDHVVTIHAVDEANGLPYLVMQLVSGQSLEARLRESGPLRLEEVLRIGLQSASALAAAHAQGLVHRDVKPANILLENGVERVKITDFGLARAADDVGVTATGQVSGTPHYMAPEQARGERVDHRADLFSLGCVLYAMCTGRAPFAAPTPLSAMKKVCDEEPPPVREVNPQVPPGLAEIIARLMRKDPADRPQSAAEVAEELGAQLAGRQSAPRRDSRETVPSAAGATPERAAPTSSPLSPRRRRVRRAAAWCAAALPVLAAAVYFSESRGVTRIGRWLGVDPATASAPAATPASTPRPVVPPPGQFAVLAASGGGTRTFATLAEAVAAAAGGDTVELRHDGRVETGPLNLGSKPLCLRAGERCTPVLTRTADGQPTITTSAPLVLEGLAFESRVAQTPATLPSGVDADDCIVIVDGAPLRITHCRFVAYGRPGARLACVRLSNAREGEIRNSQFHTPKGAGVHWVQPAPEGSNVKLRNVIVSGRFGVVVNRRGTKQATLDVDDSSFHVNGLLGLGPADDGGGMTVEMDWASLYVGALLHDVPTGAVDKSKKKIAWKVTNTALDLTRGPGDDAPAQPAAARVPPGPTTWETWYDLPGFIESRLRYAGDFRAILARGEAPRAADFTLLWVRVPGGPMRSRRLVSQLGARVEDVGPGEPYHAFRKAPAYQEWRRTTEQALRPSR